MIIGVQEIQSNTDANIVVRDFEEIQIFTCTICGQEVYATYEHNLEACLKGLVKRIKVLESHDMLPNYDDPHVSGGMR